MSQKQQHERKCSLLDYCERFAQLNVSKSSQRGTAQYKPILLLSVVDLIAQGIIQENRIDVSDELVETFKRYWNILASEYKGGLHYPFFHLQSDGFWHLELKQDFNGLQPKSLNKLKQAVEYATLDNDLFNLLQDPITRKELVDTLVATWFSASQSEINKLLQINQDFQTFTKQEYIKIENHNFVSSEPRFYIKKSAVRDSFFRKAVVHVYDYKCAFCELKVTHTITQNIVDGAHIKPFAKFYDNSVDNGISFCKNHHWAFDNGLFSIDDDLTIVVSSNFKEESPNAKPTKDFQGKLLSLPKSEQYHPNLESLQWHRFNIFRV